MFASNLHTFANASIACDDYGARRLLLTRSIILGLLHCLLVKIMKTTIMIMTMILMLTADGDARYVLGNSSPNCAGIVSLKSPNSHSYTTLISSAISNLRRHRPNSDGCRGTGRLVVHGQVLP